MSDVLQSILESAGTRHLQDDSVQDFLSALLQQAAIDLRITSIVLWTNRGKEAAILGRIGDTDPGDAAAVCAATSGQVQAAVSSEATGSKRRLLVASVLAGDLRLVLDVTEGAHPVDRELLVQLSDVCADLQRRRLLEQHVQQSEREQSVSQCIAQLHSSLNSDVIANSLATDAAAVLDCRRVAVARRVGKRRWTVVATTGVSQPNLRSDAARQICSWIVQAETDRPSDSEEHVRPVVQPLSISREWKHAVWAVVFESSDGEHIVQTNLERVCGHAALAFANSETLSRSSITGQLGRAIRRLTRPRAAVALTVIGVVVAALLLVKTELRIEVYGELVPAQRTFVFAPDDGTITDVFVDDGSEVTLDAPLCVLKNEDLEVQREAIDGELAAATARLAAIDALRGDRSANTDSLLSAEQVELKQKTISLTRQTQILGDRIAQLRVVSRMAGRVYGDRLKQLWFQRPVLRGQFLFEVANPHSGWQLDLRVPEVEARHVLRATESANGALPVTFALETSPETFRKTELDFIAASTDIDQQGILSTLAVAGVDGPGFQQERPGTGVVAYVHCGRYSAGYVWFRKVIEFAQRHTWL